MVHLQLAEVSFQESPLDHAVWLQVLGGAEALQLVQGQQVGGVLVHELRGLLEPPLLVQDGSVPHLRLPPVLAALAVPGLRLAAPGVRFAAVTGAAHGKKGCSELGTRCSAQPWCYALTFTALP